VGDFFLKSRERLSLWKVQNPHLSNTFLTSWTLSPRVYIYSVNVHLVCVCICGVEVGPYEVGPYEVGPYEVGPYEVGP